MKREKERERSALAIREDEITDRGKPDKKEREEILREREKLF